MIAPAYTVITGNYDNLRAPRVPGRYVCFSDRPREVKGWELQPFPQAFGENYHRNARIPKTMPHLLLDCEFSVYMDGAFSLNYSPETIVSHFLGEADLALFRHPGHRSIHDEHDFYQKIHGYIPADVEAEYQKYVAEGLEITGDFYAGGFIVRRHNERVARFNELWMEKFAAGSNNDQFSLYYAILKSGVSVSIIPGWINGTQKAVNYHLHASTNRADNALYNEENELWKSRLDRIREVCHV